MTSRLLPAAISRQLSHSPHGVTVGPLMQLSDFAKIRAVEVLPMPRGRQKGTHEPGDSVRPHFSKCARRAPAPPDRRKSVVDIFWQRLRNSHAQSRCASASVKTENRILITNPHEWTRI